MLPEASPPTIAIRAERALPLALLLVLATSTLGALGELSRAFPDSSAVLVQVLRGIRWGFRPSGEQNISTWLATVALIVNGGLCLAVGLQTRLFRRRDWRFWIALGVLFSLLSIDEMTEFHEEIGGRISERTDTGGFLLWAWVIPYAALTVAVAIIFLPFLWRLPRSTRTGFVLAGVIFVFGALMLESTQARIVDQFGHGTLAVIVLAIVEEGCELLGVCLFFVTLLGYAATMPLQLIINTEPAPISTPQPVRKEVL